MRNLLNKFRGRNVQMENGGGVKFSEELHIEKAEDVVRFC